MIQLATKRKVQNICSWRWHILRIRYTSPGKSLLIKLLSWWISPQKIYTQGIFPPKFRTFYFFNHYHCHHKNGFKDCFVFLSFNNASSVIIKICRLQRDKSLHYIAFFLTSKSHFWKLISFAYFEVVHDCYWL